MQGGCASLKAHQVPYRLSKSQLLREKERKANFEIVLPCSPTKPVKKLGNYGYSEEAEAVVHGDLVRAPPVPYSGTSR